MTLISLYFSKSVTYQNLMHLFTTKEKTSKLALSSVALGQTILYVPFKEEKQKTAKQSTEQEEGYNYKLLEKVFPYLYTTKTYKLFKEIEGIDATMHLNINSENGKLNLNSVYDFHEKKFINEGQQDDKKKLCQWLFTAISQKTKQPSLFDAFEKHLKERSHDFNDVTELLYINEFSEVFQHSLFFEINKKNDEKIYLTDIFTICTEQDRINPWLFSHSWRVLLDIKEPTSLSQDEQKKVIDSVKKQVNWEKEWDNSLKVLYQKDYKDLPQEIKSLLTTDFEANIFSLLSQVIIGETTSTIFTILKANAKNKPATFDIVRVYQL